MRVCIWALYKRVIVQTSFLHMRERLLRAIENAMDIINLFMMASVRPRSKICIALYHIKTYNLKRKKNN